MKIFTRIMVLMCSVLMAFNTLRAADEWPKTLTATDGTVIKIYEPQPESFKGNILKARAAISVLENGKSDPTFGTFWEVATVETDRDNRRIIIQSVKVPNIKFPGQEDPNMISALKTTLETQLPQAAGDISLDDMLASLDQDQEQAKLSKDLNNDPPKIFYVSRPSILVLIDGEPKMQMNKEWGMEAVMNTPFTIVKNNDGVFYLYGGKHWYSAPAATGPYSYTNDNVPSNLQKVQNAVNDANSSNAGYVDSTSASDQNQVSDIIVSTKPAELVQSNGEPAFTAIDGTSLSYVNNSSNDIFMDNGSKQYYVLISGRWYTSPMLDGRWQYVASNALPADFSKIPEGSPKDNVLASVAGTDAAREAVMDAQIPQTAKVDRSTASTSVSYDGDPKFENIQGTNLQYGVNTQSSVIRRGNTYYVVDKGVWFESQSPEGPWAVCTERPEDVDMIPPSSPMYNLKYVNVYDVTPDYVYMGYTPGYLNAYVYGPTVVYGTGFYYNPWFSGYYYPRPWTWGFNMGYNPWAGWSLGYGYGYGWFNFGIAIGRPYGYGGGWWGPSVYHPPYGWNGYRSNGFYGANSFRGSNVYVHNYTTNIYHYRSDVISRDNRAVGFNRAGNSFNRPAAGNRAGNNFSRPNANAQAGPQGRPAAANNVYSDRNGNVFQRNQQTNQWQQRQQNQWKPVQGNRQQVQNLNRQQQMRDRGTMRTQNFQQARSSAPSRSSSSGGSRSGGGGGRKNR